MTRKCTICGQDKELERDFHKNKICPLGYDTRCKDCERKRHNDSHGELVYRVLCHYGTVCICCGEDNPAFLTMGHPNNDGAQHRKETNATNIFWWLENNNYPDGFVVECWNCNSGKKLNEVCPHKDVGAACE